MPYALDPSAPIYVAGHRGLAGSAVWRELNRRGFDAVIGRSSAELDLRDRAATFDFFAATRPQTVVVAAARVGGIMANTAHPVQFLSDNLRIQVNVLDAAHGHQKLDRRGQMIILIRPQQVHMCQAQRGHECHGQPASLACRKG